MLRINNLDIPDKTNRLIKTRLVGVDDDNFLATDCNDIYIELMVKLFMA